MTLIARMFPRPVIGNAFVCPKRHAGDRGEEPRGAGRIGRGATWLGLSSLKYSTQLGLSVLDPHAGCRCVLYAKIGAFSLGRF